MWPIKTIIILYEFEVNTDFYHQFNQDNQVTKNIVVVTDLNKNYALKRLWIETKQKDLVTVAFDACWYKTSVLNFLDIFQSDSHTDWKIWIDHSYWFFLLQYSVL